MNKKTLYWKRNEVVLFFKTMRKIKLKASIYYPREITVKFELEINTIYQEEKEMLA